MSQVVLSSLDKEKFGENVSESLKWDNVSESCYTTFNDAIIEMIGEIISEILEKDGWEIKRFGGLTMFSEKDSEKIFDAFLKNSEFIVTLKRKVDEQRYEFKEVIIKFNFPEEEKKKIAETYVDIILEGYYYLDMCLFVEVEEDINVDIVSRILSNEVYGLLSPEEIKTKFKDWIEEAINIINGDEDGYDD
jgi:hypothetical protein